MKIRHKILIFALALLLAISAFCVGVSATADAPTDSFTNVVLTVGTDETERRITWYSTSSLAGAVNYAPVYEMQDGAFPAVASAAVSSATAATNKPGYYSHKATLTDLKLDTDYVYRLSNEGEYSDLYYFSTDPTGNLEFVFVGDPQVSTSAHSESWKDTLTSIKNDFGASLVVSAGDQISTPDSEEHYDYFLVDELAGLTLAPTVGPGHDARSVAFTEHFNLPNVSTEYGVNETSANYWYTYNATLFMHLNMSDASAITNGEHKTFMEQTIAANPNAKWKIVILHNALFSAGNHSNPDYTYFEGEIGKYRQYLPAILTELDIDIVLSGHDHIYVRSKIMDGTTPTDDEPVNGYIDSPSGTLHICASSSTGSKFYQNQVGDAAYAAVINDEDRKSAIRFSVTDDSLTLKSYFLDDMTVFDSLTLYKEPHVHTPVSIDEKAPTCTEKGNEQYWSCTGCILFFADEACTVVATPDEQTIDPLGHDYDYNTCDVPRTCQRDGCTKTLRPRAHYWLDATCTAPETCRECGTTQGEPLGHKYAGDCDTVCDRCRERREAGDHTDADGDKGCDVCRAAIDDAGETIIIIIVVSALSLALVAALSLTFIRRKKHRRHRRRRHSRHHSSHHSGHHSSHHHSSRHEGRRDVDRENPDGKSET